MRRDNIDPKISVVMPVYNGELYIAEALQSIKEQTVPPLEVIVVDDGSTDGTLSIIKRFPCKVLRNKVNRGIGYSRQRGAEEAKGDHVAYLMADDYWHPQFLEHSLKHLDGDHGTFTNYFRCDENLKIVRLFHEMPQKGLARGRFRELVIEWALRKNQFVNSSCVIIPKKWFRKVKFLEELRSQEDIIFLLDTVIQGLKWHHIPRPLLFYRIHSRQITRSRDFKRFNLLWNYLYSRLLVLGVSEDALYQARLESRRRAFPSIFRRAVGRIRRELKA